MSNRDEQRDAIRQSGLVYGAVLSLVFSVLSMLLVGWALDRWLDTEPYLIITGIVLGMVVGFYQFIKLISRLS